jgi:hypothetical protein
MDIYNGYNQIQMVEENKEKIALILEWGAYVYLM